MKVQTYASACALLALFSAAPTDGQELSEAQVIEKFLSDSPYAREARARAAAVRAEAAGRTLLPNPIALSSREGAGYAAFFASGKRREKVRAMTGSVQSANLRSTDRR